MRLYLARHGDALDSDVDPQRALSELGIKKVKALGVFLEQEQVSCKDVYHSGKLRAEQTAELLCNHIDCHKPPQTMQGLLPNDEITDILAMIEALTDNTLLVGHLPYLAHLASKLLFGHEDSHSIQFRPSDILCLEQIHQSVWSLVWHLPAQLILDNQV